MTVPKAVKSVQEQEPIGIIISRRATDQPVPRFSAYVWAMADDAEKDAVDAKVA